MRNASGRDLLVSAQTGSGKTVAFGLAMATTLMGAEERLPPAGKPMALIIAPDARAGPAGAARAVVALRRSRRPRRHLRRRHGRTCGSARAQLRRAHRGRHAGAPARSSGTAAASISPSSRPSFSMKPTRCSISASARTWNSFSTQRRRAARRCCSPPPCRARSKRWRRRYQRDAVRIETVGRNEQHADIDYRAIRVVPGDTENAVVNVLRFQEARAPRSCSARRAKP